MDYEDEIKELNKKVRRKNIISLTIIINVLISIIIYLILNNFYMFLPFAIMSISIVGIIVTSIINTSDNLRIHSLFKENIVKKVLNDNFTDAVLYDYGMDEKTVEETGMINTRDRYNSNDLLIAKYKNVPFKMSDIIIQEEDTDSDGNTSYHTVFRGQYIIFNCKNNFKTNIEVCSKNFSVARRVTNYKTVRFEDVEFDKMFYTAALNEIDAFYLFTPPFMEKIKELNNKYGSIMIFFLNNEMHMLIDSGNDLFNLYRIKNFDSIKETKRIEEEIKFIKDIVDSLELGGKN